jgi:hypothetical protein
MKTFSKIIEGRRRPKSMDVMDETMEKVTE